MKVLVDTCVIIDALQSCVLTRNVKDYMKSSVEVYEPTAFLKLLEAGNDAE